MRLYLKAYIKRAKHLNLLSLQSDYREVSLKELSLRIHMVRHTNAHNYKCMEKLKNSALRTAHCTTTTTTTTLTACRKIRVKFLRYIL